MTLKTITNILKTLPAQAKITNADGLGFGDFMSDRGNYVDVAISSNKNGINTVGHLLVHIENNALNKTFQGYKGGDFLMNLDTTIKINSMYGIGSDYISAIVVDEEGYKILGECDEL